MVDNYPVISQVKSLVQAVSGNMEGARETQDHFINDNPVLGDVNYLIKLSKGDKAAAKKIRRRANKAWSRSANNVPVVGHIKGALHLSQHENKRAKEAFESANRATALWTAGILSAGPALPAAVVATAIGYDAIDSLVHKKTRGLLETVHKAVDHPNSSNVYDAIVAPGLTAARTINPIKMV